jgi:release factor glutamine methyltransferase
MFKEDTFSGKDLYEKIRSKLRPVWGNETDPLSKYLLKEVLDYDLTDIISTISRTIEKSKLDHLEYVIDRLSDQEPIQYILGYSYFLGRKFIVTPDVLIPRPETEELVLWIKKINKLDNPGILDIGVGSGCIGISLALEIGNYTFTGLDWNRSITEVAQLNAMNSGVKMKSKVIDILQDEIPGSKYDIIVSNPPYVLPSERKNMRKNVLGYEPEHALFVPEDEPLIFYHRITELASDMLNKNGMLFFEINESFGDDIKQIMKKWGFFNIEIKKDIHNKDRFVFGNRFYS